MPDTGDKRSFFVDEEGIQILQEAALRLLEAAAVEEALEKLRV